MKKMICFLILSAGCFAHAGLDCSVDAMAFQIKPFGKAEAKNIQTFVPPNVAQGTVEADPVLDIGNGYQVEIRARVQTVIDAAKPVSIFNDYGISFTYTVIKIENGSKRAVGTGGGGLTATQSRERNDPYGGCGYTVCASTGTENVDVETILINRPANETRDDAYKKLPDTLPFIFTVSCNWSK